MRLVAQGRIYLPGEQVFREPRFWDKVKHFLGGEMELATGEQQLTRTGLALTEQVQGGLARAGVDNAVSLVVDTDVVFQDNDGVAGDAEMLVAAMRTAHDRFDAGFATLRAVFEHATGGLHALIEVTVKMQHPADAPAATIAIGARADELRPQEGETMEAARERIGKRLADAALVPTYKNLLADFCSRLQQGLATSFPRGRVEMDQPELAVVRPSAAEIQDAAQDRDQRRASLRSSPAYPRGGYYGPYYDPWGTYYRDPMDTFVNLMILDAMISPRHGWGYGAGTLGSSWGHYGTNVHVIHSSGTPICDASQIDSYGNQLGGVGEVADLDFDTATWDDSVMSGYEPQSTSWSSVGSGSDNSSFDCVGYSDTSSSSSWDCSSDCSFDCSSDCSWDCSSDCSWDCSSDCSWDCSSSSDW